MIVDRLLMIPASMRWKRWLRETGTPFTWRMANGTVVGSGRQHDLLRDHSHLSLWPLRTLSYDEGRMAWLLDLVRPIDWCWFVTLAEGAMIGTLLYHWMAS